MFRVDLRDLTSRTLRWGGRLLSTGKSPLPPARSLVDTDPLRELLERVLEANSGVIPGIARSLEAGWLRAIALTASSYTTGQSITWVQTRDDSGIPATGTGGRTSLQRDEPELPRAFRFLTRGLGTRETRSNDMLSVVMFQPDYVKRLIEMGEADAQARVSEIRRFLGGA